MTFQSSAFQISGFSTEVEDPCSGGGYFGSYFGNAQGKYFGYGGTCGGATIMFPVDKGVLSLSGKLSVQSASIGQEADKGDFSISGLDAESNTSILIGVSKGAMLFGFKYYSSSSYESYIPSKGVFSITCKDSQIGKDYGFGTEKVSLSYVLKDARVSFECYSGTVSGTFLLSGKNAKYSSELFSDTESGSFLLSGFESSAPISFTSSADKASFHYEVKAAYYDKSFSIPLYGGSYDISGKGCDFRYLYQTFGPISRQARRDRAEVARREAVFVVDRKGDFKV